MTTIMIKGAGEPEEVLTLCKRHARRLPTSSQIAANVPMRVVPSSVYDRSHASFSRGILARSDTLEIDQVGVVEQLGPEACSTLVIATGGRLLLDTSHQAWAEHWKSL